MTSHRQTKKEDLKTGKISLPTKEQKRARVLKKNTASHHSQYSKRQVKLINKEVVEAERERQFNAWTPNDPKVEKEKLYKARIKRKNKIASGEIIKDPKTPKKHAKGETAPLHKTTNGIAFRFKGNKNRSQTYMLRHLTNGDRLLQTNILGTPSLTLDNTDHITKLRDAADITDIKKRTIAFNDALKDVIAPKNKTDSLSVQITIDPDYTIKKVAVDTYVQTIDHIFRDKKTIENLIEKPINDETFTQFNNIVDFCKGKMSCFKEENDFVDYIKNQESIKKNHVVKIPLPQDVMVQHLKNLGYNYDDNVEITPDIFKNIQSNPLYLGLDEEDMISSYEPAKLSADYMVKTLRCITNEAITQYFKENLETGSYLDYDVNPKNKKILETTIAQLTDTVKDPRAGLNAVILRHHVETGETAFTEKQMNNICETGIKNQFKWDFPKPSKQNDKPRHLKIA